MCKKKEEEEKGIKRGGRKRYESGNWKRRKGMEELLLKHLSLRVKVFLGPLWKYMHYWNLAVLPFQG